ncbi:hypothetical protein ACPRNU_13825 [Chromobacterium vaccinii]|uniref:hypothetical protein n=1 Tax=Chromobacterium vaccinii TaxID=1108595 RepID=UPI003C792DAC
MKGCLFAALAVLSTIGASTPALADGIGDQLADSVCLSLSTPALPPAYVAGNDVDISKPGLADAGLVFEEHGKKWYRWTKLPEAGPTAATTHVYALCQVYAQTERPSPSTPPSIAFVLRADKAVGPGTANWFAYIRNP